MNGLTRRAALLLLAAALSSCTRNQEAGLNPGYSAPEMVVKSLDDKTVKLSDFKGKVVLLNFWASWCDQCIEEMPALERLYTKLSTQGFTVVALGIDDNPASLRQFKDRLGLSFPVLYDSTNQAQPYKVSGFPESFVLDRQGKILMISDPDSGEPITRIIGGRDWDDPNTVHQFEQLLKAPAQVN